MNYHHQSPTSSSSSVPKHGGSPADIKDVRMEPEEERDMSKNDAIVFTALHLLYIIVSHSAGENIIMSKETRFKCYSAVIIFL